VLLNSSRNWVKGSDAVGDLLAQPADLADAVADQIRAHLAVTAQQGQRCGLVLVRVELGQEEQAGGRPGGRSAAKEPLDVHAIMLSHAIGTTLGRGDTDGRRLGGYPGSLVMELLRIGLLYQSDDIFAAVDRFTRLWLEYGEKLERVQLRASPRELLRDATGLEVEEILAMGFGTLAYSMNWEPGKHPYMRPEFGTVDEERIEKFLELIADDMDGYKSRFAARAGTIRLSAISGDPCPAGRGGRAPATEGETFEFGSVTRSSMRSDCLLGAQRSRHPLERLEHVLGEQLELLEIISQRVKHEVFDSGLHSRFDPLLDVVNGSGQVNGF
jgi:hypothetical protein